MFVFRRNAATYFAHPVMSYSHRFSISRIVCYSGSQNFCLAALLTYWLQLPIRAIILYVDCTGQWIFCKDSEGSWGVIAHREESLAYCYKLYMTLQQHSINITPLDVVDVWDWVVRA